MKRKTARVLVIGSLMMAGATIAGAADDLGKREFDNNCAVCHGSGGKGDGPYGGIIETKIPDLTTLQSANQGVFPFDRVYQVIDGRAEVKAHGSREMPIWGNEYNEKAVEHYADYPLPYSSEGFVRGRILALIDYIHSLQQK